jgi:hypothetical protein
MPFTANGRAFLESLGAAAPFGAAALPLFNPLPLERHRLDQDDQVRSSTRDWGAKSAVGRIE